MKSDQTLSEIFDVETTPTVLMPEGSTVVPHGVVEQNIEADYGATRSNLYALLENGQDALLHALELAKSSEHPRAFEVVGGLMKQLADINTQLLELSEKRQTLAGKIADPKKSPTGNVTNNAIFVGSTADLHKMIKQLSEN